MEWKCRCGYLSPEDPHWDFYCYLLGDGKIQFNDTSNNTQEVLTADFLEQKDGCICSILRYKYESLTMIEDPMYLVRLRQAAMLIQKAMQEAREDEVEIDLHHELDMIEMEIDCLENPDG